MPKRFPPHTLLLMVLALVVFGRMWCVTHPPKGQVQPPDPSDAPRPAVPARPLETAP